MSQLTISPKFFRNERRNYSNWLFAFWRELYQNAIDAGARHIKIHIDTDAEKNPLISFADDGCGFDATIREEVYYRLGETSKGGGSVGGFGKARIVTNFSHEWYIIKSQDWKSEGSGSDYHVTSSPWINGTSVQVKMDTGDSTTWNVRQALDRFLRLCHNPNCEVTVDGAKFAEWCHKRRFARDLASGKVYTNKSGHHLNTLIVRVNGVAMFTKFINPPIQVVVEVNAFDSREILLSNRDEFRSQYSSELNQFIQSLASNTKETLRRDRRIMELHGNKPKVTRKRVKIAKTAGKVYKIPDNGTLDEVTPGTTSYEVPKVLKQSALHISDLRGMSDINELIPSAILICDSDNQRVRNVATKYAPGRWRWAGGGGNREKLLRQWTIMCEFAIQELLDVVNREEIRWRPGFYLSDDLIAYHTETSESGISVHSLMLNPVNDDGKLQYRLRNQDDWSSMLVSAAHEAAHIVFEGHNENFTILYGTLMRNMLKRRKAIFATLLASLKKSQKVFALGVDGDRTGG